MTFYVTLDFMASVALGERIGTIKRDSTPIEESGVASGGRFATAHLVQDLIIDAVFAGADLGKIKISEVGEDHRPQFALYAQPPIETREEAQRLGEAIEGLLERARTQYPSGPMTPHEMDTFVAGPQPAA